jgi:hypothetical protein
VRGGLAAVLLACAVLFGAAPAGAGVPSAFFGVSPQEPPRAVDLGLMQGTVGTLRIPVFWSECEPAPGEYDFEALDDEIAAVAAHGIRFQPVVYGTPAWLAPDQALPPLGHGGAAWASFLRALVERYGHGGEFWSGRERRQPIRIWQIWNEPNFTSFWRPRPDPVGYARLLRLSSRTIRAADPRARIALAGVAPVGRGLPTWVFLRRLFEVSGVRNDFDFVALHPYAASLPRLEEQVRRVRAVMRDAGLGTYPLLLTEVGVASHGAFPSVFVKGLMGQASFLQAAYARLLEMRRRWRIAGVDWFTWKDWPRSDFLCSFCEGAGLVDVAGWPKPAWWAFRRLAQKSRAAVR